MNSSQHQKRVLAFDVRPRSLAYTAFEGPEKLLDWGTRRFRGGMNAVRVPLADKIAALLQEIDPQVVVLKAPPERIKLNRAKTQKALTCIREVADRLHIRTRQFTRRAAKNPFGIDSKLTRYQIARALAQRFPELAQVLPPKRKPWETEDCRMSIFDAAALAMTYFTHADKRRRRVLPPPRMPVSNAA